jgi:hypothetical protein
MGERRGADRVLMGKPGGKTTLERPRRGWADNIKMDLQEVLPKMALKWMPKQKGARGRLKKN